MSEWTNSGKTELKEFENDPRFIRLCRILTKNYPSHKIEQTSNKPSSEDLSLVLSITADDEAAKLIAGITVPQMIKVRKSNSLLKQKPSLKSLKILIFIFFKHFFNLKFI